MDAGCGFAAEYGLAILRNMEEHERRTGAQRSIVDALSVPGLSGIDVEFPRSRALPGPVDVS